MERLSDGKWRQRKQAHIQEEMFSVPAGTYSEETLLRG